MTRRHQLALRHALAAGMPRPTDVIDTGQDAVVFATEDPGLVVRVGRLGPMSKELQLLDHQGPGVVRVLAMRLDGPMSITWKERLDINVEGYLLRSLPQARASQMAFALIGLWERQPRKVDLLRSWRPTRGLIDAVLDGLPAMDLSVDCNLGVTSDGRIVAFDL